MHQKVIEVRGDGCLIMNDKRERFDNQLFYEDDTRVIRSKYSDLAIEVSVSKYFVIFVFHSL